MYKFQNITIILCLYFAAYASSTSAALNSIALYIALPLAFILSLLKNNGIKTNKYWTICLLLFAWIFFSFLWADYTEAASRELHRCLGTMLLCFLFSANAKDKKMLPWLYGAYLILYLGVWVYAQSNINIDMTGSFVSDADRLGDEKLNSNTLAYYTFYTTFVIYILGESLKKESLKKFFKCIFFALFPLSFFVAMATASRQVLIIQIPLLAFLLYHRYIKKTSTTKKIIFIFVLTVFFAITQEHFHSIYQNSYLATRFEKNLNEDSRFFLMKESYEIGLENFPIGVGAGNYVMHSISKHFSHISYLELFANQGIIGVILFIWLLAYFTKLQWKRFIITRDKKFLLFLSFGLIFILDNFFYVFYLDLWLMGFFILVATHSDTYFDAYKVVFIKNTRYNTLPLKRA